MNDFWDEWRGSLDGRPVMYIKTFMRIKGFKISLHKMVRADDKDCFHTHPSKAIRIILWGGYTEEFLLHGVKKTWKPLNIGFVSPELSHRIDSLINKNSYSLWIRWPKTHKVKSEGIGWKQ
jgi:hypothetical protein